MSSFRKSLIVVLALGSVSVASGSSQDDRSASASAFRLASIRSGNGDPAAACAALSQSLEHYRRALANETGVREAAGSSLYDDSEGMEVVRAKFGC